jgi:predicted O-methyltransferase YrrM
MQFINKLLRAGDVDRISRFHTLRGELIPFKEILLIPVELALRFFRVHRSGPWLPKKAICALNEILHEGANKNVLEIGGGSSSKFFSNRCSKLVTIEEDPTWGEVIKKQIQNRNCDFQLVLTDTEDWLNQLEKDGTEYDLILIDGASDEVRKKCLVKLSIMYKSAVIVLDNSDRNTFRDIESRVKPVKTVRFNGLLRNPFQADETTFFWFK